MLNDEDFPKIGSLDFPKDLENMSVDELSDYIDLLKAEISRVEGDIAKKKNSQDAAAAFFKS